MKLTILGTTGQVGSALTHEALDRGHNVRAVARYVDALPRHPRLRPHRADVTDPAALATACLDVDAVLSAVPFRTLAAPALLEAVRVAGSPRLMVVGGAGSLALGDGHRLVDTPDFPTEYRAEALAGCGWLQALRTEAVVQWTMLSPSAFLHAGPRTGRFRLGGDTLLVDAQGESHISLADYAIAFLNELEHPEHLHARFAVGY